MNAITTRPDVTLAVTVHEPHERLVRQVEAHLPGLAARYAAMVAFCSRETGPAILDLLHSRRFGPEIEAAGGYAAWVAAMSSDPGRWVFRLRLALMIAEVALHYAPRTAAQAPPDPARSQAVP